MLYLSGVKKQMVMKKILILILTAILFSSCVTVNINFAEKQKQPVNQTDSLQTLESWY